MLEELRRRNYAESTIHTYIRTVEHFSRHFHRSPDRLGPEHIREYQAALFTRWKLAPNTVTQRLAALRFFYVQVLKRGWSVAETPYPKKVLHLPQVLSQDDVARLIDAAEFPFHRILLMTRAACYLRMHGRGRIEDRCSYKNHTQQFEMVIPNHGGSLLCARELNAITSVNAH